MFNFCHTKMGAHIGTVMMGSVFKETFPDYIPCKVIGLNEKGFQHKYKPGLVENDEEFNPSGDCGGGGLYFCDASNIGLYWGIYGRNIAMLELLDNEPIYVEKSKCKTNRFIIGKILSIEDFFEELQTIDYGHSKIIELLKNEPLYISHVKSPTEEMCITAIENDPKYFDGCDGKVPNNSGVRALGCIKNQTLTVCERAVQIDERNLKFANIQTPTMCEFAIKQDPRMLKYVKEPTDHLRDLAMSTKIPDPEPINNVLSEDTFELNSSFANIPIPTRYDLVFESLFLSEDTFSNK